MQIEVSLDTWKHLVQLRRHESDTDDMVIRRLLNMQAGPRGKSTEGFNCKNLFLPNGTKLYGSRRAHGSSQRLEYYAEIVDGKWVDEQGKSFGTPSEHASELAGYVVNGWQWWHAKLPDSEEYIKLDTLRR